MFGGSKSCREFMCNAFLCRSLKIQANSLVFFCIFYRFRPIAVIWFPTNKQCMYFCMVDVIFSSAFVQTCFDVVFFFAGVWSNICSINDLWTVSTATWILWPTCTISAFSVWLSRRWCLLVELITSSRL